MRTALVRAHCADLEAPYDRPRALLPRYRWTGALTAGEMWLNIDDRG